jgi:hypothetical protein
MVANSNGRNLFLSNQKLATGKDYLWGKACHWLELPHASQVAQIFRVKIEFPQGFQQI